MTNEEQIAYDLTVENHERAMFRAAELERENKALEEDYLRIISAQDERHRAKVAELEREIAELQEEVKTSNECLDMANEMLATLKGRIERNKQRGDV